MVTWSEFSRQQPGLAALVRERFEAHRHKTMATVRADGAPRICGTEAPLLGGELWLGGMIGNRRFADLRRDPRVAIHSGSDDPPGWHADARVSGTAVEVTDPVEHERFRQLAGEVPPEPFELFRVELTEVVSIRLEGGDTLLISTWRPGEEVRTVKKH